MSCRSTIRPGWGYARPVMGASCTRTHPVRVSLERRRSDFERDARVTAFTGSCCCCCCCLHWIGAAIGGAVGMRMGWKTAEQKSGAPLEVHASRTLRWGVVFGILLSTVLVCLSIGLGIDRPETNLAQYYLIALAVVPSLAMIPVGVPMVLGAYRLRRKMLATFRREIAKLPGKDGSDKSMSLYRAKLTPPPKTRDPLLQFSVFCRGCWCDLDQSMHLATCPECGELVDRAVISGPDYGIGVAWRAALMAFGISTAGCAGGYLVMLLLWVLLK